MAPAPGVPPSGPSACASVRSGTSAPHLDAEAGSFPRKSHGSTSLHRGASARAGDIPECRICLLTAAEGDEALLSEPCGCTGSVNKVHYSCLAKWSLEKRSLVCELCKQQYHEPIYSRLKAHLDEHPDPMHNDTYIVFAGSGTGAGMGGMPPPVNPYTWSSIMCHVVVLLVIVAVILYLTRFSTISPSRGQDWTTNLWIALVILVPAYLVVRTVIMMWQRWRMNRLIAQEQERRMAMVATFEAEADAVRQVIAELDAAERARLEATFVSTGPPATVPESAAAAAGSVASRRHSSSTLATTPRAGADGQGSTGRHTSSAGGVQAQHVAVEMPPAPSRRG